MMMMRGWVTEVDDNNSPMDLPFIQYWKLCLLTVIIMGPVPVNVFQNGSIAGRERFLRT